MAWEHRELLYHLDVEATVEQQGLVLRLMQRQRKSNGEWGKAKALRLDTNQIGTLADAADRRILALLQGGRELQGSHWMPPQLKVPAHTRLPINLAELALPLLCATGRCHVLQQGEVGPPLRWDDGPPWQLCLRIERAEGESDYALEAELRRGEDRMPLERADLLLASGLLFAGGSCARLEHSGAFAWVSVLRRERRLTIAAKDYDAFLGEAFSLAALPPIELPEDRRWEELRPAPRPRLHIARGKRSRRLSPRLRAELAFDYAGRVILAGDAAGALPEPAARRVVFRDRHAERAAEQTLIELGLKAEPDGRAFELVPERLPQITQRLLDAGWHVEAEGKVYRAPASFAHRGDDRHRLVRAARGRRFRRARRAAAGAARGARARRDAGALGDGTLRRAARGVAEEVRPARGAGTGRAATTCASDGPRPACSTRCSPRSRRCGRDAGLRQGACGAARVRRDRAGVTSRDGFHGELRGYQREGLGWLALPRALRLRRLPGRRHGPGQDRAGAGAAGRARKRTGEDEGAAVARSSCPRSLVFNWMQEAARFTPELRVLDHTGPRPASTRRERLRRLRPDPHDLRHAAARRRRCSQDVEFDYVDPRRGAGDQERRQRSRPRRRGCCAADHRLALTGTPIENHLGELWSLFEFLNPGMLGARLGVQAASSGGAAQARRDARELLAQALRPFILRRTKEQVRQDLPRKTEQTLYCELEPTQRKLYDELRDHYRQSLLERIDKSGHRQVKIQVLEALLRLRQAACHPALIDTAGRRSPAPSSTCCLPQLEEVVEEGHKALVFSQFTSLLAIVRAAPRRDGIRLRVPRRPDARPPGGASSASRTTRTASCS